MVEEAKLDKCSKGDLGRRSAIRGLTDHVGTLDCGCEDHRAPDEGCWERAVMMLMVCQRGVKGGEMMRLGIQSVLLCTGRLPTMHPSCIVQVFKYVLQPIVSLELQI